MTINMRPLLYLDLQSAFDDAIKGLAAQGFKRSLKDAVSHDANGRCAYRGKSDLKCALGHLIPENRYHPNYEYWTTETVIKDAGIAPMALEYKLTTLQSCHDRAASPDDMKSRLIEYAKFNGLTIPDELKTEAT